MHAKSKAETNPYLLFNKAPKSRITMASFVCLIILAGIGWSSQLSQAFTLSPIFPLKNDYSEHVQNREESDDWGDERIVTAGLGIKTADISSFIIRSYDSRTGTLISEDEFDLSIDEQTASSIKKGAGRIYAVGSGIDQHGALVLLVRAYDAQKGILLWEDSLSSQGARLNHRTALRTSLSQNLSIQPQSPPSLSPALSSYQVQSIHPDTGEVVWTDKFMTNGEYLPKKMENRLEAHKSLEEQAFFIQVQTFDFTTGALLWEDQFNPLKTLIEKGP